MNTFDQSTSPGTRRASQKRATAGVVLEAARAEFERVGFEAANLRTIAARAGVSAGTVLHHYGDKKDLLHAALFDELDRALRHALARLGDGPLEVQLSRLTRAVFKSYQRRPTLSRTLLKESLFADAPWAQKFAGQTGEVHAAIARLVHDAATRGELGKGADGSLFALAWLSFFYFGLILWVQGGHERPVELVERLVTQHLAGLRPQKRSPR